MRLFIGIGLNEGIQNYIEGRKEKMTPYLTTGKWTYKTNLHLTLKFIGEVPPEQVHPILKELEKLNHYKKPFDIHLDQLGVFEKKNKNILWIGLKEQKTLIELYQLIEVLMAKCGVELDSRPYIPHITLGRGIRFTQQFEIVKAAVHIKHECVHVHEVTLYESKRVDGKLAYVPVRTFKLTAN